MKTLFLTLAALIIAVALFIFLRTPEQPVATGSIGTSEVTEKPADLPVPLSTVVKDPKIESKAAALDFVKISEHAWSVIPKTTDLQKLSTEEVHHTPRVIQEAALALGDVAQLIHDKPEYQRDGLRFYEKCAIESGFPVSIRAVCLSGYRKAAKSLGEEVRDGEISPEVRALTDQIDH